MVLEFTKDEGITESRGTIDYPATSENSITMKGFRDWILDNCSDQYNPDEILASWDKVSRQLLRRKRLSVPLWEITDKEVFQKIYKRIKKDILLWITDRKISTIFNQIGQLYIRFLESESVLHSASINTSVDTKPIEKMTESSERPGDKLIRVDFSHPELCAKTHPVSCIINRQAVVLDKQNWSCLLVSIVEKFINEKNPRLVELGKRPIYGNKVFLLSEKASCGNFHQLSNGKWLNTKYNPKSIVKIIGKLCLHCGVSLDDVEIYCFPKSNYVADNKQMIPTTTELDMKFNDDVKLSVASILEERFPNGIRPKSVIDINKLKFYYKETTGDEISPEIDIASLLNAIGIHHGEKVFIVSESGKNGLIGLLEGLIIEGHRLFYYEEFYDVYADYLQQIHIFSDELLKTVLISLLPSLHYSRTYFSVTNSISTELEVLRCYETAVCLSYEQLKEKLPYVPIEKIKQVLSRNSDFIRVKAGTYTHTSKLKIDDAEKRAIERRMEAEIAEHGYISFATIDVFNNLELNPELSLTAVQNGLFQLYFSDRYEKRGNIITQKGRAINSVAIFKDYCLTRNRLTLNELTELEKEISGRVHGQSLLVAYDTMVRIDKETFVGDNEINFDIENIDNALSLFVHADVIPLQSVTSFTAFPYIEGYPWNWYLLESYCKRFSKRFMYQCLSVNSKNVGAIFRKSAGFTNYIDVLAAAVAAASIDLNEKKVGDYLFENRYIAQRTSAVAKVVTKARTLRERGF